MAYERLNQLLNELRWASDAFEVSGFELQCLDAKCEAIQALYLNAQRKHEKQFVATLIKPFVFERLIL